MQRGDVLGSEAVTSYKLRVTSYKLQVTSHTLHPRRPLRQLRDHARRAAPLADVQQRACSLRIALHGS